MTRRRVAAAAGLTVCAVAGALAAPTVGTYLIRFAGWTRHVRKAI
jgi:hypothetical protein